MDKNKELKEKLLEDNEAGDVHHPGQSNDKKKAMTAEAKKQMAEAMIHLMGKDQDIADAIKSFEE